MQNPKLGVPKLSPLRQALRSNNESVAMPSCLFTPDRVVNFLPGAMKLTASGSAQSAFRSGMKMSSVRTSELLDVRHDDPRVYKRLLVHHLHIWNGILTSESLVPGH